MASGGLGYAGSRLAKAAGLTGNEQSRATSRGSKAGTVAGTALGSLFGPVGAGLGGLVGGKAGAETVRRAEDVGKTVKEAAKDVGQEAKKVFKKLCFAMDTLIEMLDGRKVPIFILEIGDRTKGGEVVKTSKGYAEEGSIYNYRGVIVTGSHAVLENGRWVRVEDSSDAIQIPGSSLVYSVATDKHRIYSNGITFADEFETDFYEDITASDSLKVLNGEYGIGAIDNKIVLTKKEAELCR